VRASLNATAVPLIGHANAINQQSIPHRFDMRLKKILGAKVAYSPDVVSNRPGSAISHQPSAIFMPGRVGMVHSFTTDDQSDH
jgi:hypothetical protein